MSRSVRSSSAGGGAARRTDQPTDEWAALQTRLRRLEGQAHGIGDMVSANRGTLDVLQQFSALIAASREAALAFAVIRLRNELRARGTDEPTVSAVVAQLEPLLGRASRLP